VSANYLLRGWVAVDTLTGVVARHFISISRGGCEMKSR